MNHFPSLVEFAASNGGILCVEAYPGSDPLRPASAGTTELLRAIFDRCPREGIGFIFDPSHSVRIGVDYMRLLTEFGSRVRYAHGKDTVIDQEAIYLHGISGRRLSTSHVSTAMIGGATAFRAMVRLTEPG